MEADNISAPSWTWREVHSSASYVHIPLAEISNFCLEGPQISFISGLYWSLSVMEGDSRISTWFDSVMQYNFILYSVHEM